MSSSAPNGSGCQVDGVAESGTVLPSRVAIAQNCSSLAISIKFAKRVLRVTFDDLFWKQPSSLAQGRCAQLSYETVVSFVFTLRLPNHQVQIVPKIPVIARPIKSLQVY
jgi:hypothetical protein